MTQLAALDGFSPDSNRLSVLEAAIDAALDSLRATVGHGVFLLEDFAEGMPEGEQVAAELIIRAGRP